MQGKTIVVALGGNAILKEDASAQGQQETIRATAKHLVKLIKAGHRLVISHGNGPQVGNLLLQHLAANSEKNPVFPLDSLVAMTEGSIGYWLQQALDNELAQEGIDRRAISIISQVLVDKDDPAFNHPSKPIGPFYSEEDARKEMAKTGAHFVEDAGRGWRKVVPSPKPLAIYEIEGIRSLVNAGHVVVCSGGGGIPVYEDHQQLVGIEAVIDKDFASERLASEIQADIFIVLTGVDYVYINYQQENEEKLKSIKKDRLVTYLQEGHFAPGSMKPKVEAVIEFLNHNPQAKAVITSLDNIGNYLQDEAGTIIEN